MNDLSAETAEVAALLRRIVELLEALPAAIAVSSERPRRAQRRLSPADEAVLTKLFPLIARAVGTREFTANELVQRFHLEIESTRKFGRLLGRAADVEVTGFTVSAIGSGREGVFWKLVQTRETRSGG